MYISAHAYNGGTNGRAVDEMTQINNGMDACTLNRDLHPELMHSSIYSTTTPPHLNTVPDQLARPTNVAGLERNCSKNVAHAVTNSVLFKINLCTLYFLLPLHTPPT